MPVRGFTIAVMDGDRVVRWPTTGPTHPIGNTTSGDDLDVWTGVGPPPAPPPPTIESGDTWIDLATGDVYVLNPEE